MKYIVCRVLRDDEKLIDIPVVFPDALVHAMVFAQMRALLEMQYFSNEKQTTVIALSAGELTSTIFTDTSDDASICHGESTSLGVKSREHEDDQLLKMNDYGAGMM